MERSKRKINPLRKLLTGFVLFASFFFFANAIGGADGLTRIQKSILAALSFFPIALAGIIGHLIVIIIGILLLYCFVSGLFRISTFNNYIPAFEDKTKGGVIVKYHSAYPNINRVLTYRESKLASLSNNDAAQFLFDTSILDSLYTGYHSGPETQKVLSFTESKLSSMSSDRALNYLANKL